MTIQGEKEKGTEEILETMTDKFPELMINTKPQIQKAQNQEGR